MGSEGKATQEDRGAVGQTPRISFAEARATARTMESRNDAEWRAYIATGRWPDDASGEPEIDGGGRG